jgi:hypothetical protein
LARADFAFINFDQQFDTGNPRATRTWFVDGVPTGHGYLLIQHLDVELPGHRIRINDRDLPQFDIPAQNEIDQLWRLWMDRIPPGFIQQGENRVTIIRSTTAGTEAFRVANVVVHWREAD